MLLGEMRRSGLTMVSYMESFAKFSALCEKWIADSDIAKRINARCVLETKTIEALKTSVVWLKGIRIEEMKR